MVCNYRIAPYSVLLIACFNSAKDTMQNRVLGYFERNKDEAEPKTARIERRIDRINVFEA